MPQIRELKFPSHSSLKCHYFQCTFYMSNIVTKFTFCFDLNSQRINSTSYISLRAVASYSLLESQSDFYLYLLTVVLSTLFVLYTDFNMCMALLIRVLRTSCFSPVDGANKYLNIDVCKWLSIDGMSRCWYVLYHI